MSSKGLGPLTVAVARDVVRHVLRQRGTRRAVYRDTAVVRTMHGAVAHVRARAALLAHEMEMHRVATQLVGLSHLEELDTCNFGGCTSTSGHDVPTEARQVGVGARVRVRA